MIQAAIPPNIASDCKEIEHFPGYSQSEDNSDKDQGHHQQNDRRFTISFKQKQQHDEHQDKGQR